ncbi:PAS domain-containing protein [candidate division KSB1 bacterium]|nr:PAS domain-containing protein [candidate division KSB1 bacterium]
MIDSNIKLLAIGFNYWEINKINNSFAGKIHNFDFDFAVSIRDSLYRLDIANYNIIILNINLNEIDDIVSLREAYKKVDNLKTVLIASAEEWSTLSSFGFESFETILKNGDYYENLTQVIKGIIDESRDPFLSSSRISKSFLPNLVDAMHEELVAVGVDYRIRNVNNKVLKKYKLKSTDVIGRYCYEFFYKSDRPCNDENRPCPLKQVISSGQRFDVIHYFEGQSKNKENRFNISAFPTYNEFNTIVQVYLVIDEENKNTEYKIDQTFLASLLEGMNEGFVFFDSSNNVVLINKTAESLLDLSRDAVLGNTIFKLPLGKGLHWLGKLLQEAKTRYLTPSAIKVIYAERQLLFKFNPLFDEQNNYIGGFLYITENYDNDRQSGFESDLVDISKFFSTKIVAEG